MPITSEYENIAFTDGPSDNFFRYKFYFEPPSFCDLKEWQKHQMVSGIRYPSVIECGGVVVREAPNKPMTYARLELEP